jgi:polar amino acid transport system substrate-binding protein
LQPKPPLLETAGHLIKGNAGMFRAVARLLVAIGLMLGIALQFSVLALSQSVPDELSVVTRVLPPFVIKDGDGYTGFSIDLWDAIAKDMGKKYHFIEKKNINEIIGSMSANEGDAAIAAISITSQREQLFDFSQPMFDAGLQIMVRKDSESALNFRQLRGLLTTGPMPFLLALLVGLIVIPGHLVWLAERNHKNSMVSASYFPGIFEAIWWSTGATAAQQPDQPRSGPGRLVAWMAILVSMVFMTYFQATVTTALTVDQLKGDINGVEDLVGHKIGTLTGSTGAQFLRGMNLQPTEFSTIEEAEDALDKSKVDAVVYDAPVLLYYVANKGAGRARMVGDRLRKENYGILFPRGSALRKPVNETLLKLRESGVYDALYAKWFASAQGASGQ